MRRFYAPKESFTDGGVSLDAEETRHLRDVLRLREGAEVSVFDGRGNEYAALVEAVAKTSTTLSILGEIDPPAPESPLKITLASVAMPGDKYDLIVQKAVELGVVQFLPLASVRSEPKLKDLSKKLTRWRRIALDAAKQCGRATLMSIAEPMDIDGFLSQDHAPATRIFFSEREGSKERLPGVQQFHHRHREPAARRPFARSHEVAHSFGRRPDWAGKAGPAVAAADGRHGAFPSPACRRTDRKPPDRSAARRDQGRSLNNALRGQHGRGPPLSPCWTMIFRASCSPFAAQCHSFGKRCGETARISTPWQELIHD